MEEMLMEHLFKKPALQQAATILHYRRFTRLAT